MRQQAHQQKKTITRWHSKSYLHHLDEYEDVQQKAGSLL